MRMVMMMMMIIMVMMLMMIDGDDDGNDDDDNNNNDDNDDDNDDEKEDDDRYKQSQRQNNKRLCVGGEYAYEQRVVVLLCTEIQTEVKPCSVWEAARKNWTRSAHSPSSCYLHGNAAETESACVHIHNQEYTMTRKERNITRSTQTERIDII
jgi:hypothetical protein